MNTIEAIELLKEDLRRKDYSEKTVKAYSDWIIKLGDFFNKKDFDKLGCELPCTESTGRL